MFMVTVWAEFFFQKPNIYARLVKYVATRQVPYDLFRFKFIQTNRTLVLNIDF